MTFNAIVDSFVGYLRRKNTTGTKTMRVMKLTALIVLTTILQVAAKGVAQDKITFTGKDVPLEKVFTAIKKQTSYLFLYNDALLVNAKKVTLQVKNASLEDVLSECFKDQPFDYKINGRTIFIINRPEPEKKDQSGVSGVPPGDEVKGRITNAKGEPLSGASIYIKRSGKFIITNAKGEFFLKNVALSETITISYTGYSSQTVKVGSKTNLLFVMQIADDELDKVVIQGYGKISQRLSTGNVAVVTAEEIEKQPVINPLMALQGRVAGLDIQQTSGYASAPIIATIRGLTSVDPSQVSDPLYIIDGVPLTVLNIGKTQNYATGSYGFLQNPGLIGPANGQSPLFSINPRDIESITVLKDADATSIYGSRGANGVILITTKSGKPGKTNLDLHVDMGVKKVTRYWEMLNTQQYIEMRREAFSNDGRTPDIYNAPDLLVWDSTRYTDWQKALYGRAGKVTNVQVSLTGGNSQTSFRIGGTYTHATEITTASGADKRGAISLSLTHRSINQRLSITFSNGYCFTQSDMIQLPGRITIAPNAPSIYDSSGKLNWHGWNATFPGATGYNPFGSLLQPYNAKTNFLNSNLVISYEPFRGLTLSTSFGYNNAQSNQMALRPISSQDPANKPTGSSQFGNNSNKNWIIEPQITYNAPLGPGNLNILIGGTMQGTSTQGMYITGDGYTSDALLKTISNAPQKFTDENYGEYRYSAIFGRIGYNIANKYLINFNARRDGSSNYGPGNQFGNFASVGAAWIFTEEKWFKKHLSLLSFGKLQGSYGTTGSDGGIPYGYITRWTSNGLRTYADMQTLIATQHANPDYQWQLNRKLEGSVSLGFFRDWITIRATYYRNRTNNQLLAYPTPMLSGFNSVLANLPALVQNAGWEFSFGGKGVSTKFFSWAPSFNFSINKNKFLSFPGLGSSPYRNNGRIGKPLNGLYVLQNKGVDPQTGQYVYDDKNHDGIISPNYDTATGGDVYFKRLSPSFATGFGFNFGLKGFDISIFFSVKKQTGINALAQGSGPGGFGVNQPVEVLARWRKPGDVTNVGKFSTMGAQDPNGFLSSSDIGYTDASYIRLQNLSLSYSLPESFIKKSGIQSFKLFINANNIFVITKYKGIDPEIQSLGALPPTRTIVGGLSINL